MSLAQRIPRRTADLADWPPLAAGEVAMAAGAAGELNAAAVYTKVETDARIAAAKAAARYVHEQGEPAETWVIDHLLGHRPVVAAFTLEGHRMRVAEMHPSDNRTLLMFNAATAGVAVLA